MKKVFVFLAGFALIAAGNLVAQEDAAEEGFSFGGAIKTGLRLDGSTVQKQDPTGGPDDSVAQRKYPLIYGYSDAVDNGTPFRAELDAQYVKGNIGAKLGLIYDAGDGIGVGGDLPASIAHLPAFYNAYAWADLFKDHFRINGGLMDDAAWGNNDIGTGNTSLDAITGVRLEIKPVTGLNIGVSMPLTGYFEHNEVTVLDWLTDTIIGVGYSKADFISVNAALRFPKAYSYGKSSITSIGEYASPAPSPYDEDGKTKQNKRAAGVDILFGINLTAVKNLQILADGEFYNIGNKYYVEDPVTY